MPRRAWGVILVVSTAVLPQCLTILRPLEPQPPYLVETVSATCQSRLSEPSIDVRDDTLIVTESLQTPNPCYGVEGTAVLVDHQITVEFFPDDRGGACIECLGTIVGRITITDLPPGDYTVMVHTRQRESRVLVTVP
jgi:hypothetical protein